MKTTFFAFSAPSKNLILNKKIYSASHSEFRKSQGVKIFAQNYYKASKSECNPINVPDSVTKNWKRVRISKEVCIQKKTLFNYVATWKRPILHFLCLFKRRGINLVILRCVTFWNKELQRVRFWIRKFKLPRIRKTKTHKNQIFAWKILQSVKFELKPLIRFRFWKRNFKHFINWKTLHSKNHVLIYFTLWKRRVLLFFPCFLKKNGSELEFLHCVTLGIQNITKSQIFC